jgi:virginiamycin B lyase
VGHRERSVGAEAQTGWLVRTLLALLGAGLMSLPRSLSAQDDPGLSAGWLSRLPDGETKRKFILDCTGCHQFDEKIARVNSRPRSEKEWVEAVSRMLGYAGARTGFPVISADRNPGKTAAWLVKHLGTESVRPPELPPGSRAEVVEFLMPEAQDLPHDIAVEPSGTVLVTGMFTHRIYRLDPSSRRISEIPIPVPQANPRAIEVDSLGQPWVVLGSPNKLAMMAPDSQWRSFDVGMYAHSLALDKAGKVWFNGHFTRAPELIGSVDAATGKVVTYEVPAHPTLSQGPGGPIPYEIRVGPDGRVWGSELIGNRIFAFTPATRKFETFRLPHPHSGPRRFDIDARGIVWIPAYAANLLLRFEPGIRKFTEIPLPIRDAVPYIIRVDSRTGALWIGTAAADVLLRYDPADGRFETFPLPTRGAMIRHLAIDSRSGAVWAAYGASPGIPARIARLQPY